MLQVKAGDVEKMGLLFERYHRALYNYLFHMTRQKEVSEDIVQNTFFRMLKYRQSFTGKGEFRTWMYHVARNVMNDHFRKNKRTPVHRDLAELEERIDGSISPDDFSSKKEELKRLGEALMELDGDTRELLILCRFQGLKYQEIARILDISEGAVKVRVHRALHQLKDQYFKVTC